MVSNLVEEFLIDYLKKAPQIPTTKKEGTKTITTKDDLINILADVELLIRKNKDKSLEEIIELIIIDNVNMFEEIRKKYGVPGYTASVKVGNNNVKLYGGNINYLGEPMPENALFDIASMTKFYTQIIAYNLISEGYFNRSSIIKDLDPRFVNLGNLSVDQILTFSTTFHTDGYIKEKTTIDEALNTLYNITVTGTGRYDYNDMGLMVMKEVMEKVSGLSYDELVDKYIVKPLGLNDTHIIVPRNKFHLITGTPNASVGHINDMSANAVGGYSGHAGIFASSDDVIKLMLEAAKKQNSKIISDNSDFFKPSSYLSKSGREIARAVAGNVYTHSKEGLDESFIDTAEPLETFGISGSTRTNAAASPDSAYTMFFNPASVSIEYAKELEERINRERIANGEKPIVVYRQFEFDRLGKTVKLDLIDPREILPAASMIYAVQSVAMTTIKLRFLDFVMKKYEKELEEVNIVKNVR